MASKLIGGMGLHPSVTHRFSTRNIFTAKDALCRTELELMELLDVPLETVISAVRCISNKSCPPCQTVLSISEAWKKAGQLAHLPTLVHPLDQALCGGIPSGIITEIIGPAGIGKTQFCLMLTALAVMPDVFGLNGSVIYFDTEQRFTSQRLIEIAQHKFSNINFTDEMIKQLATHIFVIVPTSVTELLDSLQNIQTTIIEHHVKLLIVDSVANLMLSENGKEQAFKTHDLLGKQASILKLLAESFRFPVIVTNQARTTHTTECPEASSIGEDVNESIHEVQSRGLFGTKWAHAVNLQLVLENYAGRRWIRIAKCPLSARIAIPFLVTVSGIEHDGGESIDVLEKVAMTMYGTTNDF